MSLCLFYNQSCGLVAFESEAMGVKALNIENTDYIKSIQLELGIADSNKNKL